jgi:hypothetical protein
LDGFKIAANFFTPWLPQLWTNQCSSALQINCDDDGGIAGDIGASLVKEKCHTLEKRHSLN